MAARAQHQLSFVTRHGPSNQRATKLFNRFATGGYSISRWGMNAPAVIATARAMQTAGGDQSARRVSRAFA
jgi:hypothetical protein